MAAKEDAGVVMPLEELKPLLHLARRQPLSCAIAMDRDKQGHILLHRRTKPKKLLAQLKRQAKAGDIQLDLATSRFGRASVDGASDSGKVTFTVNKPAPGPMTRAMLEQVRPAGLQRCEIIVDESLEGESSDDEGSEDLGTAGEPRVAQGASPGETASAASGGAPSDGPRYGPGHPIFEKGRQAWTAVRAKLQSDIDGALQAMVADYGQDDPRVQAVHERVEPIMRQLDDTLAHTLAAMTQNAAPADRSRLVGEAEKIIARYRAFVDGEPMVAALDRNPFHPMTMRKTLDTALAALTKTIAGAK